MAVRKRAVFTSVIKAVDAEKGTITAIVSTNQIDRYGDIILPEAFVSHLASYLANPVFLWGHKSGGGPEMTMGRALSVEPLEDGLQATFEFARDINPLAKMVFELYAGGFLKGFSIGGIAHKMVWRGSAKSDLEALPEYARQALEDRKAGLVITELELCEISACGVPANPGALATAIREGRFTKEMFLTLGMEDDAADQVALLKADDVSTLKELVANSWADLVCKMDAIQAQLEKALLLAAPPASEQVPAPVEQAAPSSGPFTLENIKLLVREALAEHK